MSYELNQFQSKPYPIFFFLQQVGSHFCTGLDRRETVVVNVLKGHPALGSGITLSISLGEKEKKTWLQSNTQTV